MTRLLYIALAWALTLTPAMAAAPNACAKPSPMPLPALIELAPGLWQLPAAPGESDAVNRGRVSNLLLAVDGADGWLVGSGPSPAFGRALGCLLRARWPAVHWQLVSAWPHPEAVLGIAGLQDTVSPLAHWAHAEVAAQMAARCAGCVQRLRARLGETAADLGDADPVRQPTRGLQGETGDLGPWRWWRLDRAPEVTVTVWAHQDSGIVFAPGLVWDGAAADARDADISRMAASTAALDRLTGLPAAPRWLGEQGGLQGGEAPALLVAYWRALQAAVDAALDRGDGGESAPMTLPGIPASMTASPNHGLNWQRAWRQAESRWLQRSLR